MRNKSRNSKTVVNCYSLFDKIFPGCGLLDYTEGIYNGDPTTPYETAQRNQLNYLLDQADCRRGTRILEIGCGNGNLLAEAERRGATVVGLTISPEQVQLCRRRGLDARLLNYRNIGGKWNGRFDAVIANGPIEHFVQPGEAAAGKADKIYRDFFSICHRAIDPESPVRKLINTTIHYTRQPDPNALMKRPWSFRSNSVARHWALLAKSFGGWYPVAGQFERCAEGCFEIDTTVDGTEDYRLTSEHWLQRVQSELKSLRKLPAIVWRSLPFVARHPRQAAIMLYTMLIAQSWNWQFRTANPPTRLLRQTWAYRE